MAEDFAPGCTVRAWKPAVPGVAEVFHAHVVDFAYPVHCHDTWTVLIVDAGAIRFDLDRRERGAAGADTVTLIPPGVSHDGRPAAGAVDGFWKRNLCLDAAFLPTDLVGRAVEQTSITDPSLRRAIADLHHGLDAAAPAMHAEERLAFAAGRIRRHLGGSQAQRVEAGIATELRSLLDEHVTGSLTLDEAGRLLDRSPEHLTRSFTAAYGISPHAYVIGRRVEIARRLLLDGHRPSEVATEAGFYDQAHLTRHFKRHTNTTPARFAA